jgi:ATP-dependent Lon protease
MVGQWISNPSAMGTAIAIKGPPGTGKTSLVKEGISKILGREFAFIALGGTGDSSFLEGHSYTYEGSSWGKIVQILVDSKCMNPVIYFDELDKISDTPRGEEIVGILTHLTDTSQNNEFHDKYFSEISFDLSKCLFIFSYNDESRVNPILKDRMYRIQTKGYEAKDKVIIAKNYLAETELDSLNRIVTMYLDYAEMQAKKGILMKMKDWVEKLNAFLKFNEQDILNNAGKISHEVAEALALREYDKYKIDQDKNYVSDFDREVVKLLDKANSTRKKKKK